MKYTNKLVYKEAQNNIMHHENNLELGVKSGSVVKGFVQDFSEFKNQYFTIEALENGSVGIVTIDDGVVQTGTRTTGFTYSLDGGATWTTNNNQTFQIPVTKGQKVLWQRNAAWPTPSSPYRYHYDEASQFISGGSISGGQHYWQNRCSFHCTCKYKVYGNIGTVATGSTYFAMFCELPKSVHLQLDVSPTINIPGGAALPIVEDAYCNDEYEMHKLVDAYGLYIASSTAIFASMFENCQRLENGPYFEKFSVGYDKDKLISGLSFYDVNTDYQFDSTFYNCYSLKNCRIRMQNIVNANKTIFYTFANCLSMKYGPTYLSGYEAVSGGSRKYFYIYAAPPTNTFYNCQSLLSVYLDGTFITDTIDGTLYLSVRGSDSYGFLCACKSLKTATFWYTKVNVKPVISTVRWDDYVSSRTTIKGNLID